ncbi:MAG: 2OG-Fe(II) oxygenase [Bacteroidota bacterium]
MIADKLQFIKNKILIIENFIHLDICNSIIKQIKDGELKKGKILVKDKTLVDESYRRVTSAIVDDNCVGIVSKRILEIMPSLEERFKTELNILQKPSFLFYKKGDFFKIHTDSSEDKNSLEDVKNRKLSIIIFLNTETKKIKPNSFCGGTLNFYKIDETIDFSNYKFEVHGEAGTAIIFKSDILHEVSQVTNGERFTVVSWIS